MTSSMASHRMNSLNRDFAAKFYQEKKSSISQSPDEDLAAKHQIIEDLIEKNKQDTWNKKPFEKAQFNQCIPNPDKPGEYITVQLLTLQLMELGVEDNLKSIDDPDETL